uniref:Uncharacterized protein n=1 Tax=Anopheles dirus TaxID=7168 RepID=A0A182NBG2_9DIPT
MTAISTNSSSAGCLRLPDDGPSISMLPATCDSQSPQMSPGSTASSTVAAGDGGEFIVID